MVTYKTVKIADLYKMISKSNVKVMFIRFIMKGNSTERNMVFSECGTEGTNSKPLPMHRVLEDVEKEILTVYDWNKGDYRRISFQNVVYLIIGDEEYKVVP